MDSFLWDLTSVTDILKQTVGTAYKHRSQVEVWVQVNITLVVHLYSLLHRSSYSDVDYIHRESYLDCFPCVTCVVLQNWRYCKSLLVIENDIQAPILPWHTTPCNLGKLSWNMSCEVPLLCGRTQSTSVRSLGLFIHVTVSHMLNWGLVLWVEVSAVVLSL